MQICVLIATYQRPDDLRRCLDGLAAGIRLPDQILVVRRPEDAATEAVLLEQDRPSLKSILVDRPGVVAAINIGLDHLKADIVAFIDDDAIPHADWLERIVQTYTDHPTVGAVGGRDIVHKHGIPIAATTDKVGSISWFGRMTGNHHLGQGTLRKVRILKGVNMSFRVAALDTTRADHRLWGNGAQVHFEIGLCSAIIRRGWSVWYDPQILVDHYPAIRHDEDRRSGFSMQAQKNKAHNEQVMVMDALPRWSRIPFILWSFGIGTADVPGLGQLPRLLKERDPNAVERLLTSWQGRMRGIATWWQTPR